MIKAEFRKLIKTGLIFMTALLVIILCTVNSVLFYNNFDYGANGSGYGIRRYQSIDDANELLHETENNISEINDILQNQAVLPNDKTYYEKLLSELKLEAEIYSYIIENNITFEAYNDYAHISETKYDSAFSAFSYFARNLNYFLPFIVALLGAIVMPLDFHNGTYKFLYSSSVSRKKILGARFIVFLIFSLAIACLACISSMAIAFSFGNGSGAIVFANLSTVVQMNFAEFFLFETANILFRTMIIGCIIFASSLLMRNIFLPVFLDIAICIGGYVAYFAAQPLLNILFIGYNQAFLCVGAISIYCLYYFMITIGIALLCGLGGAIRFLKRDLK